MRLPTDIINLILSYAAWSPIFSVYDAACWHEVPESCLGICDQGGRAELYPMYGFVPVELPMW